MKIVPTSEHRSIRERGHRSIRHPLFISVLLLIGLALFVFGPSATTKVVGTWETPLLFLGPVVGVLLVVYAIVLIRRRE